MFNRRCFTAFCLFLMVIAATSALTQNRPGKTVIRSITRVVNVNLVVTDAEGNLIKELTKDDVTLLDGGKPQAIGFFSAINSESALPASTHPSQDILTNRPEGSGGASSVTILLFDVLNSRWTSQGHGLDGLRKFLRQIEPKDHVGLYLLNDEMKILYDFRPDASVLVGAIQRYDDGHSHAGASPSASGAEGGRTNLERFLSGEENHSRYVVRGPCAHSSYCQEMRDTAKRITTSSLQEIARQLSQVLGRKTLIWITDSVPGEFIESDLDQKLLSWRRQAGLNLPSTEVQIDRDNIERMIRLMNDSGIAVYPVSAEGLQTEDLGFRDTSGATAGPGAVEEVLSRLPDPSGHMDMDELAKRTGGRAFFNRNDLETGIRRALDDSRFSYSLAYYPDHDQWRGEWRKIKIKVNRPGVTVLARSGYFALPDARPLSPKNRFEFLSEIAASPVDSPQLPFTVRLATSPGAKGTMLDAQVHLNPELILTVQNGGHWKGSFEVVYIQLGEKNKVLNVTNSDVDADLDAKKFADVSQRGWDLSTDLPFMPGAIQLCVILRDKLFDNVGSLHISLAPYADQLSSH